MTREELLKNLKEKFKYNFNTDKVSWEDKLKLNSTSEINSFIFEIIIPEVLKSVIYRNESIQSKNMNYLLWYTDCQDELKQKAKELYWIYL